MAKTIAELLGMETTEQDATLNVIDVFGEKSKDADDILNQEEMIKFAIDVAIGSTPAGAIGKGGKGVMSFLKGLLRKPKSQNIAKPNRRETEKIINKLMKSVEPDKAFMREVAEYEKLKGLVKPKGIRQFGKFNRQLQKKNYE